MAILSIGGTAVSIGGSLIGLGSAGSGGSGGSTVPVSTLGTIPGSTAWWDASEPAGLLGSSGVLTQYAGAAVTAVASKISGGPTLTPTQAHVGWPHVNGLLGAVGSMVSMGVSGYGVTWPALHQSALLTCSSPVALTAGAAWWLALAWTRPNIKQADMTGLRPQNDRAPLAVIGGVELLGLDNAYRATQTGTDTGTLSVLGTAISTTMPLRHCGTVLLVNVPGVGVSVYLNGNSTPAATGISASTLPGGASTLTLMGGAGTYGSSQCWFHEAAIGGSIDAAGITAALTSLGRYQTGARSAARIVAQGQSNLSYVPGSTYDTLRKLLAYYTGAVSVDFMPSVLAPGRALYLPADVSYLLDDNGSDPSIWTTAATGVSQIAAIAALPPILRADMALGLGYYSEASSGGDPVRTTYAGAKPVHKGAWARYASLVRTACGKAAAQMPWVVTRSIAYGPASPDALSMVSDGFDELAADSAAHFAVTLQNTWDSAGRGATDTVGQSGDSGHISDTDHENNFRRMAAPTARVLLSAGYGHLTAPTTLATTGPRITGAQFTNSTGATPSSTPTQYVRVTVTHDTGNALVLQGQANTGLGWTVRSGWASPASRGTAIKATAAAILDATHLLVTLASVPSGASSACRLLYCEGPVLGETGRLGTGNAVTDNAGSVAGDYNVAADLGSAYAVNYPLPSLHSGIAFS